MLGRRSDGSFAFASLAQEGLGVRLLVKQADGLLGLRGLGRLGRAVGGGVRLVAGGIGGRRLGGSGGVVSRSGSGGGTLACRWITPRRAERFGLLTPHLLLAGAAASLQFKVVADGVVQNPHGGEE
jgi:hypothetical protein